MSSNGQECPRCHGHAYLRSWFEVTCLYCGHELIGADTVKPRAPVMSCSSPPSRVNEWSRFVPNDARETSPLCDCLFSDCAKLLELCPGTCEFCSKSRACWTWFMRLCTESSIKPLTPARQYQAIVEFQSFMPGYSLRIGKL